WSQVTGPGSVTFHPDDVLVTNASFTNPGVYKLQLHGTYGVLTDANWVTITVRPGTRISGGEHHTLIADDTEDKHAWGCGWNIYGQLGDGTAEAKSLPVRVCSGEQGDHDWLQGIEAVGAGYVHSLALDANHTVWAWGYNYDGELGNGEFFTAHPYCEKDAVQVHRGEQEPYPPSYNRLERIVAVAAARSGVHSIALESNGHVWTWGYDGSGRLGNGGSNISTNVPTQVVKGEQNAGDPCLTNIIAISGGESHTMALEEFVPGDADLKGRVYTWGSGSYGKLGHGSGVSSSVPVVVHSGQQGLEPNLVNIVAVSAGWYHSIALEKYVAGDPNYKGRVYAWGSNGGGQLGDPDTSSSTSSPVVVHSGEQGIDPNLVNIVQIGAGDGHSMALDVNGNVWTWGANWCGQLGDGSEDSNQMPVKVVAPDRNHDTEPDDLNGDQNNSNDYLGDDVPIIMISAGYYHCLAMDQNGNIYSWGQGDYGRLGIGSTEKKNIPQMLGPLGARVKNLDKPAGSEWYFTIAEALGEASDGDTLVAYPGIYYESVYLSKNVTLRSLDPNDPEIVAATVIDGSEGSSYLVKFASGNTSTLSGFSIRNAGSYGIYCDSSSPKITNNIICHNEDHGIYCSSVDTPLVTNNLIFENGTDGSGSGVYLSSPTGTAVIRNNTIVANEDYGIYLSPGTQPEIRNCIIWDNGSSGNDNLYITSGSFSDIDYCGLDEDEDDYTGGSNNVDVNETVFITTDPNFYYYMYRLQSTSSYTNPCINAGASGDYSGETDIDGDPRVMGGQVDIGVDEFMPYVVEAGDANTATVNEPHRLSDASVTYRGLPEAPNTNLTVLWSVLYGPEGYSDPFGDANTVLKATATFDKVGQYVLMLEVFEDGNPAGWDVLELTCRFKIDIHADPNEVILPEDTVKLSATITGDCPDANTLHWVGPIYPAVVFDTPGAADTNATFSEPAIYQVGLYITSDVTGALIGEQYIWVPVNHQQIVVDINCVDEITLPDNRVRVIGSISGGVPDSVEWLVPEGAEDLVAFDSNTSLQTWVEFSSHGIFEIGLVARDQWGYVIGVDTQTITVNPPDDGFLDVDAGEDQQIPWPQNFAFLSGTVDGNDGPINTKWVFGGPANLVTFDDPCVLNTRVVFNDITSDGLPEAGVYEFGLVVIDACDSNNVLGSDSVLVWLDFKQVIIDAGPDQTVLLCSGGVDVDLVGEVILGSYDSVKWVDSSGLVDFNKPNELLTSANFPSAGEYELGLLALGDSNEVLAFDTVVVTVSNQQVIIDAGLDQQLTNFPLRDEAGLHGRIIEGNPDSIEWVFPQSGIDSNGDSNSLDTWVEFSQPGVYQIGLLAKINDANVGWDIVTIKVYPEQASVTANVNSNYWEVMLPNAQVTLTGTVWSGTWTSVDWVFNDPNNLLDITDNGGSNPYSADVDFYQPGTYEIGFVVKNGSDVVGFDTAVITVHPELQEGLVVTATSEKSSFVLDEPPSDSCSVSLTASITGEGTHDYNEWVDPTGQVAFNPDPPVDDNSVVATFSKAGLYEIAFVVRNGGATGEVVGFDTVSIFAFPPGYQEVMVDAGQDQQVDLPLGGTVDVNLVGDIVGCPDCNTEWVDPSDGLVQIEDVNELQTTATFTYPGVYEMGLVALNDGNVVAVDTVIITVNAFNNQLVYVDAGEPNTITFLVDDYVNLSGTVVGSLYNRTQWVFDYPEMPELVTFGDPNSLNTTASFARPGIYTLS
ncbi:MAG: RCC1 domain-containing protein, partial [Planctomycetota bacterium]